VTSVEPGRRLEATEEEVAYWVERKRDRVAKGEKVFTVEDLHAYQLDEDETWELVTEGNGCMLSWVAEDGSPGGTYVKHAVLNGAAYMVVLDGDEAIPALRRDPRVSVVFDGGDGVGAVTIRGTVEFVDDPRAFVRVLLAAGRREGLSDEQLAQRLRAARPGRECILHLKPERFVTFTHKKIVRG